MAAPPVPAIFWPVTITAGVNDAIRFSGLLGTYSGTVAAGTYTTVASLLAAVETGAEAATRAGPVAYSADAGNVTPSISGGIVTLDFNGDVGSIHWAYSSATEGLGTILGADVSGDQTLGTANADQIQNYWTPEVAVVSDDKESYDYATAVTRTAGGQNRTLRYHSLQRRTLRFGFLSPERVFTAREGAVANTAIQRLLESDGVARFAYYPDRTSATKVDLFLLEESAGALAPERLSPAVELYSLTLRCGEWVSP